MFSNSKFSELDPRGEIKRFSNDSEIQKKPKLSVWGGGVKPNCDFSPLTCMPVNNSRNANWLYVMKINR